MRALPVERPGELVSMRPFLSEPLWQTIRANQQAFSQMFVWGLTSWNTATDGEYRLSQGLYVSGQFFDGLGVSRSSGG